MSDYIYGSSLRAAKSKANYLFEGEFRRKPSQNLSGASRILGRGELLQQAQEQRQNREDVRRKEKACVLIQATWRSHRARLDIRARMCYIFDEHIGPLLKAKSIGPNKLEFDESVKRFVLSYNSKMDEARLSTLTDVMLLHKFETMQYVRDTPNIWMHRLVKLLSYSLRSLQNSCDIKLLTFLDIYTDETLLSERQTMTIWNKLVCNGLFRILRSLLNDHSVIQDGEFKAIVMNLVKKSLSYDTKASYEPVVPFFLEFIQGLTTCNILNQCFQEILSNTKALKVANALTGFRNYVERNNRDMYMFGSMSDEVKLQNSRENIWLAYGLVTTVDAQIDTMSDFQKTDYIITLAWLLNSADYITSISLISATKDEDGELDETHDESDDFDRLKLKKLGSCNPDINNVIGKIVSTINESRHTNELKPLISNIERYDHKLLQSLTRVCIIMLDHEPLAIFNCRLLYTIAFCKEFSTSLWKHITTIAHKTLYGPNTPIYIELQKGHDISQESWRLILPPLKLFCSLYSYLLPTLDDVNVDDEDDTAMFVSQPESTSSSKTSKSEIFVDKEWIVISAVLRDMCVGFIELLYQDKTHHSQMNLRNETMKFLDKSTELLLFQTKVCFKALVRLVCQIYARDSRKQFCPKDHWICKSIVIPTNREINFQLVTSQQGRLMEQMTRQTEDDDHTDRLQPIAMSEVKIVLILQEIPFVIPFRDRVQIFHQLLLKDRLEHRTEGYRFGLPGSAIELNIRRDYIYEDAFSELSQEGEMNLKMPLKVSMINAVGAQEPGIDGGGLTKEFLSELLKSGFNPMRGFFKTTQDQLLYPNPSVNVLFAAQGGSFEVHYEFLGRILGKAIFEKIMVELPLASFFLAKLLARKNSLDVDLHNLASLDPVLYKNLIYLKNYQGDVADLNLDFTIANNELGENELVELKPEGSKIPVTRENKIEYVHLVANYRLNTQIRAQCAAFKRGLAQLIDLDWLRMFSPRELQILVSGAPTVIDTADWRRNTIYGNGYSDDCTVITTFWNVVSSFDEEQKRKLLKFVTSCSLPPLLGFKELEPKFSIAPSGKARLPTASTCMNFLKLPDCEDEATMRSKLLYAIESNSGFELS